MLAQGFWDNQEAAQRVTQELSALKERLISFKGLQAKAEDLRMTWELGREEDDPDLASEAESQIGLLKKLLDATELEVLLSGPYDSSNAIISLHPGAGGTESQDWAEMLMRMYLRWAEEHQYKTNIVDLLPGDEAGIKSATIEIIGLNAYGYLSPEKGVHRLVRISPFDSAGRRHTSFASVEVLPEVQDDLEVEIKPDDLRIDTFRAGGAGGQHVNKTDSAVRITHLPTGIVVQCQSERSQMSNKNTSMKLLKAKLLDLEIKKKESERTSLRGEQREIAWGSQIRSYVFHPYSMVKDHRTGVEVGNVNAVINGDLDQFISAYLKEKAKKSN
jgi:peptide chain release factor 2